MIKVHFCHNVHGQPDHVNEYATVSDAINHIGLDPNRITKVEGFSEQSGIPARSTEQFKATLRLARKCQKNGGFANNLPF